MFAFARKFAVLLRPRFSLAALLLFMLLVAAFLAWIRATDRYYQRQWNAQFRLMPLGGFVNGLGSERAPQAWLGKLCGCENWVRIYGIDFYHGGNEPEPTEQQWQSALAALRDMPDLRYLDLDAKMMLTRPDGLQWLLNAPQVEEVRLEYIERKDHLETLRQLPRLRRLELSCMRLDEAYFRELAKLDGLEQLVLGSCPQCAGIAELAALPKLTTLELRGPDFNNAEIVPAASFAHLKHLELDYASFTDAGLLKFVQLKTLESIDLTATDVTPAGIAAFQAARPDCRVITDGHD